MHCANDAQKTHTQNLPPEWLLQATTSHAPYSRNVLRSEIASTDCGGGTSTPDEGQLCSTAVDGLLNIINDWLPSIDEALTTLRGLHSTLQ